MVLFLPTYPFHILETHKLKGNWQMIAKVTFLWPVPTWCLNQEESDWGLSPHSDENCWQSAFNILSSHPPPNLNLSETRGVSTLACSLCHGGGGGVSMYLKDGSILCSVLHNGVPPYVLQSSISYLSGADWPMLKEEVVNHLDQLHVP